MHDQRTVQWRGRQRCAPGRASVLFSALLVVALAAGCAARDGTPLTRTVQARELYTSTLRVLTSARAAGKIDDRDAVRIEQARRAAAQALELMEAEALGSEKQKFERAAAQFDIALDKLLAARVRAQQREAP